LNWQKIPGWSTAHGHLKDTGKGKKAAQWRPMGVIHALPDVMIDTEHGHVGNLGLEVWNEYGIIRKGIDAW
jgi:hypothetical protein